MDCYKVEFYVNGKLVGETFVDGWYRRDAYFNSLGGDVYARAVELAEQESTQVH